LIDDASRDIFEVSLSQASFAAAGGSGAGDPTTAGPGSRGSDLGLAAMLALELPELARYLDRYDVEVQWMEAEGPQKISRTTFAFDWETASIELATLFQATSGGELGAGSEGESGERSGDGTTGRDSGSSSTGDSQRSGRDRDSRSKSGQESEVDIMKRLLEEKARSQR